MVIESSLKSTVCLSPDSSKNLIVSSFFTMYQNSHIQNGISAYNWIENRVVGVSIGSRTMTRKCTYLVSAARENLINRLAEHFLHCHMSYLL